MSSSLKKTLSVIRVFSSYTLCIKHTKIIIVLEYDATELNVVQSAATCVQCIATSVPEYSICYYNM